MPTSWTGARIDKCPLCSSSKLSSAGARKDGATVSRCEGCGLGFLNPMPRDSELAGMYSDYYSREDGVGYSKYQKYPIVSALDHLLWYMLKRYAGARSTLLDVGCAYGTRVLFFSKKGMKASGVDLSEEAVAFGRKEWSLDLRAGKFESFESDKKYAVVTMIDFVEHVPPNSWAPKTARLTNPGSIVMILTPDFDCYRDHGERWTGYNKSFEHIVFFSRKSLTKVLEANGFEVVTATNVRSQPTVPDGPGPGEPPPGPVRKAARSLAVFRPFRRLLVLRVNLMEQLAWRKLPMNAPRQNSLLVVARRTSK